MPYLYFVLSSNGIFLAEVSFASEIQNIVVCFFVYVELQQNVRDKAVDGADGSVLRFFVARPAYTID